MTAASTSNKTQSIRTRAASAAAPGAPLMLTADDIHLFSVGMWQRAWEKMGAHIDVQNGVAGWLFRVWAPSVASVHIVGDFNGWDPKANPLTRAAESDIWEGFVADLQPGDLYKYVIETANGELLWKADPFGFYAETCPGTASKLWDLSGYTWKDGPWLKKRAGRDIMKSPLNIYEVHLGSWKRHGSDPQGEPREDGTWPGPGDPFPAQRGTYYTYDDLSEELVAYVSKMGYTHIEIMPLMEHPFDGSWGYQATGYFAATSRYGTPQQLMHFVDACHKAGIGVILDWVPGGFCANAEGLATFNGQMLFEREIHPNWGTHKFDFGRPEVRSFLVSNVLFWIEQFHVDGIRMDGVSSMLYLNFGVDNPADKKFNKYGTEEDLDASAFIRQVNCAVGREFPDVMMIAEESTAWPLVTYPAEDGGLGFHLKWDMGWMNDTLHYMQCDFPWRPGNHSLLTFSIMYAFSENFVLPLSHDEVVNGKCSLIGRMPGDDWRRFAGLRTLAFYQMTHPGAKLSFMGDEIGQQIEWRYYESIEWFLAEQFDFHAGQQRFVEELNHLYTGQRALWQRAYDEGGFEWIDADNNEQSIISFVRHGDKPADDLLILINFDPASYETFKLGVPREGDWELVFNSDASAFGGSDFPTVPMASSKPEPWNGRENSIEIAVPGLAGVVYKRRRASSYKPPRPAKKTAAQAKSPEPVATERKPAAKKASAAEAKTTKVKSAVKKTTTKAKAAPAATPAKKAAKAAPTTAVASAKTAAKSAPAKKTAAKAKPAKAAADKPTAKKTAARASASKTSSTSR